MSDTTRAGRLDGKVAIVTGAGQGIGAATVAAMVREGASCVAVDLDGERVRAMADALTPPSGTIVVDVEADAASEAGAASMVEAALERFGRVDILHNNVGVILPDDLDIEHTPLSTFEESFRINVGSMVLGTQGVLPSMLAQGSGSIVTTASQQATTGDLSRIAYGAAKAALMSITRMVATTHGRRGIRCNAIAPALVMSEGLREYFPEEIVDIIGRHQGLRDFTTPDDVADMVLYLASDESRAVTGQVMVIDAGMSAMGSCVPAFGEMFDFPGFGDTASVSS